MQETTTLNADELAHEAANEAVSIVVGVQVLSTIPETSLTPSQKRAMKILQDSAGRLVGLIDELKEQTNPDGAADPSLAED